MVIEDYGHRRNSDNLNAARNGWPGKRIVAVLLTAMRTRDLFDDFGSVLSEAGAWC
jgi:UDP-N-acetylmuramate-alanine ligase